MRLLTVPDVEALPDLQWRIEGILPQPSLVILYGEPGCGKTFVALSMAFAAADGQNWLGRRTPKGSVLYIAAEGLLGLKIRLQAHRRIHFTGLEGVRFLGEAVRISSESEVTSLVLLLDQEQFRPDLIIVDTLARVSLGKDENSAKEIGEVVAGLESLKRETGATVLVIHHTRKNGDSERGSSALRGAADVMIKCEKAENLEDLGIKITCSKMKDAEPFNMISVMMEKVALGDGRSSLVLGQPFDGGLNVAGHHAAKILELITERFAECGATNGELQKAFTEADHGSKSTFDRAFRDLKSKGKLQEEKREGKTRYRIA